MEIKYQNILFEYISFQLIAKIIGMAVTLRLDNKLSAKSITVKKLAAACKYPQAPFYRLLRALETCDIVKLEGKERVKAGKLCKYLDLIRTPHFLLGYQYINNLPYALKNNIECFSKTFGKPMYTYFLDHPQMLKDFKIWCTKTAQMWLPEIFKLFNFSKFKTIVDIGGGEGEFLAKILQKNRNQTGILFDQLAIIKSAKKTFKRYQIENRTQIQCGNFFKILPHNGNLYILSRVLINWSNQNIIKLLRNCYCQMPKKATLVIIDFFIPEKSDCRYKRAILADLNILAVHGSILRTKSEWLELIRSTKFKIKRFYSSTAIKQQKSFLPLFLLELTLL